MNWPVVELASAADVIRGVTFSKGDTFESPATGLVPVLRAGNISDQLNTSNDLVFVKDSFVSDLQRLRSGDIVVCMSSGSANVLGKSAVLEGEWKGSFGAFLAVVRAQPERIRPQFLSHYLRTPKFRLWASSSSGIGIKNIRASDLKAYQIPLPPLSEQKRIARILDQAARLYRLRARAIETLNTLGQAIFQEMFGDVFSNPKKYEIRSLGQLIKVSSGTGLVAKAMKPGKFPVYGGNGISGYHDEGPVPAGTIVIGRVGAYCGAVHVTDQDSWVTDNALLVTERVPINSAYLSAALTIADLNQYAGRAAQPLISGSRIYPVEILLPPLNEQDKYDQVLKNLEAMRTLLTDQAALASSLFASLQHRAFRGEL